MLRARRETFIMNTASLKALKQELQADVLKIMCDGAIKVDWRTLFDLQMLSDGRSLKETDDDKILHLAESLLRFGIVNNLQVWFDENGDCYCFDAHHRRKAFEVLAGIGVEIPMLPATRCLASSKIKAMQLLLVKESKSSWVNYKVVPDYLHATGFSFKVAERVLDLPEVKWNELCEAGVEPEEDQGKADEIPEPPPEVHIKAGDLIELGAHRLLCGDSTQAEDVARLMGGEKVDMVFADPPYGIDVVRGGGVGGGGVPGEGSYAFGGVKNTGKIDGDKIVESKTYKKVEGDQTTEAARGFYQCCLSLGFSNIVLWGGNYFTDFLPPSRCWIVWDKEMTGNFSAAEMAWTSFEKGGVRLFKFLWNGLSREGSRDEELKSRVHPTQKPVGLFVNIFEKLEIFGSVYDGFLGSGSTLIACEKTNRKCYGMEIDPQYCQVTIQRWVDFAEQDIIKINGQTISWSDYIDV